MRKTEDDIPLLTREQLGVGVRGKYFSIYSKGINVVVLSSDVRKAMTSSEAVDEPLARVSALAEETNTFTVTTRK